jgi:hypothetical protein
MTSRKPKCAAAPYGPLFSAAKDAAILDRGIEALLDGAKTNPKEMEKLRKGLRRPRRLAKAMGEALAEAAASSAPHIYRTLKTNGDAMLRDRRAQVGGFEARLYDAWKEPIDLVEMMIVVAVEAAEGVSAQWPSKQSKEQNVVFEVVRRLQARACQVANEVATLLKTGYAPAAHARWRTLHETTVTIHFIVKHGSPAAEAYLAHEYIDARKAAKDYQRYCRRLGYKRYTANELASIRRKHHTRVKKYGTAFKGDYGWAAVVLGRKSATFRDIEKHVGLDHLRPYYKMASIPVHAGIKAIRFTLALRQGTDLILTGPSNLGLADPGHGAALSLAQATIAMLTMHPSSDTIIVSKVLLSFSDDIGQAFLKAQQRLLKRGRSRKAKAVVT